MKKNTIHFSMQSELTLVERAVPTQRTIEITLQAPAAVQDGGRPRLNLALVLDRSGSMSGGKLSYAKKAAQHLIDLLDEDDRVAVVAYDDAVTLAVESTPINANTRQQIKNKVQAIKTGGSTNLSEGWLTGCGEVAANHVDGQLERTLLLTDGLANAGIIELEELAMHARELSSRGVSTSTFGIGEDFNEHLLEAMATAGGGLYHYIRSPHEIPEIFKQEFSELAAVTARDVKITLDIPVGVSAQALGAWRVENEAGQMHIYTGAMQAGRSQTLYVTVLTPPVGTANTITLKGRVTGRGDGDQVYGGAAEIIFEYCDADRVKTAVCDQGVLERSAQVRVADAVNESLKLERAGEREKAAQNLNRAIAASAPYMKPAEAKKYEQIGERMQQGLQEEDRKSTQYSAYQTRRNRDEDQS